MDPMMYLVNAVSKGDEDYVSRWSSESASWMEKGVYEKVASMIHLHQQHVHADICAGFAVPLFALHRQAPPGSVLHMIALERIAQMLVTVKELTEELGIPTAMHLGERLSVSADDVLTRVYEPSASDAMEGLFGDTTAIGLIQDDVRHARVFRQVLGERRLDSATFLFPGTGPMAAYEAPYSLRASQESSQQHRRTLEYMRETRKAALSLAAEYLKPGGQLVVAERVLMQSDVSREAVIETALGNLRYLAGSRSVLWDVQDVSTSMQDVSSVQQQLDWGQLHGDGIQLMSTLRANGGQQSPQAAVFLAKLLRNSRSFT